eukprot:2019481-Pyramimonas_sp.AAC.1
MQAKPCCQVPHPGSCSRKTACAPSGKSALRRQHACERTACTCCHRDVMRPLNGDALALVGRCISLSRRSGPSARPRVGRTSDPMC